jgi:hypothetical protein
MIKIQKRAITFYNHLKGSDSQTVDNKQAGTGALFADPTEPQDSNTIRLNQIRRKQKYFFDTLERINKNKNHSN